MRVTFAVEFAERGGGVDLLQRILRHKTLEMSLYYSRMGRERRALNAMVQLSPVDLVAG
jgi:integrase